MTKPRNQPCPMCYKAFDRPSTLRKHLLVHTGEKAFVCDHCRRRFSVASNRNRHLPRCPALKSRLAAEAFRRNSLATSDVTDSSDAPLVSCDQHQLSPQAWSAEFTYQFPPVPIPNGSQRRKRTRRPPSPVHWVPESLKGMRITDLKTYVREHAAKAKKESQEKRAKIAEEKRLEKLERQVQVQVQVQRRRGKKDEAAAGPGSDNVNTSSTMEPSVSGTGLEWMGMDMASSYPIPDIQSGYFEGVLGSGVMDETLTYGLMPTPLTVPDMTLLPPGVFYPPTDPPQLSILEDAGFYCLPDALLSASLFYPH